MYYRGKGLFIVSPPCGCCGPSRSSASFEFVFLLNFVCLITANAENIIERYMMNV